MNSIFRECSPIYSLPASTAGFSTIFRGPRTIAQRILKSPEAMRTRRWFLFRPSERPPKLVHKIEAQALESLPGKLFVSRSERVGKVPS